MTGDHVQGDKIGGDKVAGDKYVIHHARATAPPLQLPRRPAHFQGREEEIGELLAGLQPGRTTTLVGPGGIGKTAVAAEALWRICANNRPPPIFKDGIIFYTFYGHKSVDAAMGHVLRSLGVDQKGNLADLTRMALGGKALLLFLDGAEEADALEHILDVAGSCGVLITSRRQEDVRGQGIRIGKLPLVNSEMLLRQWGDEQAADVTAMQEICELVGNLPLALALAGRYLATSKETAEEYLEWARSSPLEALDFGPRRGKSVPVLLAKSIVQVSKMARRALSVAGMLQLTPFGREAVAASLLETRRTALLALGELVNYGLLERTHNRYQIAHPLIRTFARERVAGDEEQLVRLADYFRVVAEEQNTLEIEGHLRLDNERAHIMHVLEACAIAEQWTAVDGLVWAVFSYLDLRGYSVDRIKALELGARSARETGDKQGEGNHLGNLGLAYRHLGEVEKAIDFHQQACTIAQEIGNRRNEGHQLGNMGVAYAILGEMEKAIDFHQQALTIAQEIGDRRNEGNQLGNLGLGYYSHGEVEKAIDFYKQALTISQEIGDRRVEGNQLGNLGLAYLNLGEVEKARGCWQAALLIFQAIKKPNTQQVRQWLDELE